MSSSSAALSLEKTETPESNAPTSSGSEAPGDAIDTTLPQIRRLSSSDIRGKKKIVRKRRTMPKGFLFYKDSTESYKRYFCKLLAKRLTLSADSEDASSSESVILLSDVSVITTSEDDPVPEAGSFFFQLRSSNYEHRFYTTDPDAFNLWVSTLARKISKRNFSASLTVPFDQLVQKMKDPVNGFQVCDRKWRFKKYNGVFIASEAVDWMQQNFGISRAEAVDIGNRLLQDDIIHHCVNGWRVFKDDFLFFKWSTEETRRVRVVVLGGGIAGSSIAKSLDSDPGVEVTLVDRKDYFEMTPAVLRTIAIPTIEENVKFVQKIVVKHDRYIKYGNVVVGESVREVLPDRVILETQTLPFDYLVIATGSLYGSNIKSTIGGKNVTTSSRDFRAASLSEEAVEVQRADSVLIVGGGPVGVELAAEIISTYPNKRVILVHRGEHLLPRARSRSRNYVTKFLMDRGVEVILGQTVPEGETSSKEFTLKPSGYKIKAQKAFFCTGIKANSEFMNKRFAGPEFLSKDGFIKVNEYFQIHGHKNIFACGDIADLPEEKMAERAIAHADLVVGHIRRLCKGKDPKVKYSSPKVPPVVFLALGPSHAVIMARWDYVVAGSAPAKVKSAFLTSYASNLRNSVVVSNSSTTQEVSRWRGSDTKLPCPPTLQNQLVLIQDAHTALGFLFANLLLQNSVKVRAAFPQFLYSKKKRELEESGAVIVDADKISSALQGVDVVVTLEEHSSILIMEAVQNMPDLRVKQVLVIHQNNLDVIFRAKEARKTLKEDAISLTSLSHAPLFEILLSSNRALSLRKSILDNLRSQRVLQFDSSEAAGVKAGEGASWISADDVVDCAAAILFNPALYRNRDFGISGPEYLTGENMASEISLAVNDDITFLEIKSSSTSSTSDSTSDGSGSQPSTPRGSRSNSITEGDGSDRAEKTPKNRRMTVSELDLSKIQSPRMPKSGKSPRSGTSSPSSSRSGSVDDATRANRRSKNNSTRSICLTESLDLAQMIGRTPTLLRDWLKQNLHHFLPSK